MTQLSDQQLAGIEKIKTWHKGAWGGDFGADVFRLFGPAGTGKTTMAKAIPDALGLGNGGVVYGTFTGKAAHVLRSKGASPVSTIHAGIYFPTSSEEARRALADAQEELAGLGTLSVDGMTDGVLAGVDLGKRREELEALIPQLEANARRVTWELNEGSDWANAGLIVLDEVSMVNAKLAADIESYGVPILVLGDPAQLPPVDQGGYYTNATPDHLLTEIHRQALENPITALATRIRESQTWDLGLTRDDMKPASVADALEADQVIVWSNKRRWAMINAMRAKLSRQPGHVVPGDRIMCLTNNKDLAVFNGQQFDVLESTRRPAGWGLTVRTDDGHEVELAVLEDGFLGREMQDQAKNSGAGRSKTWMLGTYAQAITCHKAQGSEYDNVYVVNEMDAAMGMTKRSRGEAAAEEFGRQWMYTAVTRAKNNVTITAPRPGR